MELYRFIDGIEQRANENIKAKEGDYIGEDGLWYCGKCHTRKQARVEILGTVREPMCLCRCESERRDREIEDQKRRELAERLRREGFSEPHMQQWTFENDDMSNEKATKVMRNYVENFPDLKKDGKGLLLYGSVGTGKTYAACEVANALIDRGYRVLVTNFSTILNTLQGTFEKQEYIDSLNKYSLLVVDDLGIERDTAFAKEQVFNIIDGRYRAGLPMIITTNMTIDKLKNPTDIESSRIYDRILERCFPFEISGGSRRRKAVRDSYDSMKNILGLD
jgi:DNA replication protein DnaC